MISDDCDISLLPLCTKCGDTPIERLSAKPSRQPTRPRLAAPRTNINAEPGNGHRPSLRRKLILGIILGSFFFLVVSCFYWADLHAPKVERAKFKFNQGERQ